MTIREDDRALTQQRPPLGKAPRGAAHRLRDGDPLQGRGQAPGHRGVDDAHGGVAEGGMRHRIAASMRGYVRGADAPARIGGGESAVLRPGAAPAGAAWRAKPAPERTDRSARMRAAGQARHAACESGHYRALCAS